MKLKQYQKGLAMVEAAIILPVFILIMFGIAELGIVLYDQAVITNISREAARSGIALRTPELTDAQIQTIATDICEGTNLDERRIVIGFRPGETCTVPAPSRTTVNGDRLLSVTVNFNYFSLVIGPLLTMFPGDPFPNPLRLSATTTMYME
jgi:Flp pilus assembly protein TadG